MRITPAVAEIERAIRLQFAAEFRSVIFYSLGIYNRRLKRSLTGWSQHAWGNAWDVGVLLGHRGPDGAGSRLAAWLHTEQHAGRLPVGGVLWRVPNHHSHLHIEGAPEQTGTPPLLTDGEDVDMEKLKELVTGIQQVLLDAGYGLPRWGADGLWGSETRAALLAMAKDARRAHGATLRPHTHKQPDRTGEVVGT